MPRPSEPRPVFVRTSAPVVALAIALLAVALDAGRAQAQSCGTPSLNVAREYANEDTRLRVTSLELVFVPASGGCQGKLCFVLEDKAAPVPATATADIHTGPGCLCNWITDVDCEFIHSQDCQGGCTCTKALNASGISDETCIDAGGTITSVDLSGQGTVTATGSATTVQAATGSPFACGLTGIEFLLVASLLWRLRGRA